MAEAEPLVRTPVEPPRPARASDSVVRHIKEMVLRGELRSGQRLPSEKELARQFGLSRVTIRDALRVLESEGFVRIRVGAGGGVFVSVPGPRHVTESLANLLRVNRASLRALAEARLLLEPEVAALAAQRARPKDLEAMHAAVEAARAGRQRGDPYFIPHSVGFHTALAEASGNPVLVAALASFRALFHEVLARLLPDGAMATRAVEDHQAILDAVRARDPERARSLMREHLLYFAERVQKLSRRRRVGSPW
ncbi:MAG: FadR/GntR family transcriptional regulator [Armatimonadota bacterium]|nr:FadR/GntR family transcriptional regulator [Armatimonadota bacterium]